MGVVDKVVVKVVMSMVGFGGGGGGVEKVGMKGDVVGMGGDGVGSGVLNVLLGYG